MICNNISADDFAEIKEILRAELYFIDLNSHIKTADAFRIGCFDVLKVIVKHNLIKWAHF